jgi:hypothetical protein
MFRLALAILASLSLMACSKKDGGGCTPNATIVSEQTSSGPANGLGADNTIVIPGNSPSTHSSTTNLVFKSGQTVRMSSDDTPDDSSSDGAAVVDLNSKVIRDKDKQVHFTRNANKSAAAGGEVFDLDLSPYSGQLKSEMMKSGSADLKVCSVPTVTGTFSFNSDYTNGELKMLISVPVLVSQSALQAFGIQ